MTIFDNVLIQFTIAWLLQYSTIQSIVISIYDRYYNLRRLLLQFTTGITIHDRTNITFRELKHQRRPRLRKRHLKSGFALPQTLYPLLHLQKFGKCSLANFCGVEFERTVSKFRKSTRKLFFCVFPSATKREIRHFHDVVVQRRLRKVQKRVMQVQSCFFLTL